MLHFIGSNPFNLLEYVLYNLKELLFSQSVKFACFNPINNFMDGISSHMNEVANNGIEFTFELIKLNIFRIDLKQISRTCYAISSEIIL